MELPFFGHAPIDIHSHFNHGSLLDCEETDVHLRSYEFVMSEYARFGVHAVGFSTYASVLHGECAAEENDYLSGLAERVPAVYQWVVIDPRQKMTFEQAEKRLADHKCLGIKIHPDGHGYDIDEYGDAIFSFAHEHKAAVLMHPQKYERMPFFADKYRDMKLILAHLGGESHIDAMKRAKYGNIYTDTSGIASGLNNVAETAVKRVGAEKILFGTDTYAFGFQFGRIAFSSLAEEDKRLILYKNAERLFPQLAGQ